MQGNFVAGTEVHSVTWTFHFTALVKAKLHLSLFYGCSTRYVIWTPKQAMGAGSQQTAALRWFRYSYPTHTHTTSFLTWGEAILVWNFSLPRLWYTRACLPCSAKRELLVCMCNWEAWRWVWREDSLWEASFLTQRLGDVAQVEWIPPLENYRISSTHWINSLFLLPINFFGCPYIPVSQENKRMFSNNFLPFYILLKNVSHVSPELPFS